MSLPPKQAVWRAHSNHAYATRLHRCAAVPDLPGEGEAQAGRRAGRHAHHEVERDRARVVPRARQARLAPHAAGVHLLQRAVQPALRTRHLFSLR